LPAIPGSTADALVVIVAPIVRSRKKEFFKHNQRESAAVQVWTL
jgi:hypothetical protein